MEIIVEDSTTPPNNNQNQGNNNNNNNGSGSTPETPDGGGTGTNPDTSNGSPGTNQGGGENNTPNHEQQYKQYEGKTADVSIGDGTTNHVIPSYILKVLKDGVYIITRDLQPTFYEWSLIHSISPKDYVYTPKVGDKVQITYNGKKIYGPITAVNGTNVTVNGKTYTHDLLKNNIQLFPFKVGDNVRIGIYSSRREGSITKIDNKGIYQSAFSPWDKIEYIEYIL